MVFSQNENKSSPNPLFIENFLLKDNNLYSECFLYFRKINFKNQCLNSHISLFYNISQKIELCEANSKQN